MEGNLDLRDNVQLITTWTSKYFILSNSTILYCSKKRGKLEAKFHLEVCSVNTEGKSEREFRLRTGEGVLHLRAKDRRARDDWVGVM